MASLDLETTISHYKIKGLIGAGGMGEVYKAVDLQLGRVVALKTIHPKRAADPNIYQRFIREARAASILTHPGICTIYEIGQHGEITFIAMQYLEGKTLQHILSDFGPPAIELTVKYALDVIEALEEAHRNGVIHRDIKPSNILINLRNHAVVLDFGLAKQVSFADGLTDELPTEMLITSTAMLIGTGPYMPPEQIKGENLDARSDIFSFGVTLYELLTGTRPFQGRHSIDVLHSILHDEPKTITEVRPEVDEELAAIVAKAMKKDKAERYQTASEMHADLLELIQAKGYGLRSLPGSLSASLPLVSRAALKTREIPTATGPVQGPRVFLWPAVVLVAVAALLIGAWLIFKGENRADSNLAASLKHRQLVNWRSEPGESHIRSALSRDGTMIAYSATREGTSDIWVKQTLGEANPIRIASGLNPIWSPDNQQIAFITKQGDETGIWRVPALGGSPALIKVVERGPELVSWSNRRPVLYYSSGLNLFGVNLDTGQTEQITKLDNSHNPQDFNLSPAEDSVSYVDLTAGQADIWVLSTPSGDAKRLTNDVADERNPVWHPDGKRLIYSSIQNDTYQLFVGYLDGSSPVQITFGENDSFVSSISADGKKILYSSPREESDIWGVKVDTGEEFEVTSTAGVELWPDVSPDHKLIAFQATKPQGRNLETSTILIKSFSGGQQVQVSARGQDVRWSSDGQRLSFLRGSGGLKNLWVVNPTGSNIKQLTQEGAFASVNTVLPYNRRQARAYSWSPDSRNIVYCNQLPSGECRIAIVAADGSGESRIISSSTSECFNSPLWSMDGLRVTYFSSSRSEPKWKVMTTELETGKSEVVYQDDHVSRLLGWLDLNGAILIATDERHKGISAKIAEITILEIVSGQTAKVLTRLNSAYLYNIQLSPDGRRIAFASHQEGRDNIWLIPATGGMARKITANTDPRFYFSSLAWSPDGKNIYYGKQSGYSLISEISEFK